MIPKEKYFTPDNLQSKSIEFLDKAKSYYGKREFSYSPGNSALLVLDMQDYFINESSHAFVPSALTIIPLINSLIDAYSSLNLPVIFTKNINTKKNSSMMAKWWKELLTPDNPLSCISGKLHTGNGRVIIKNQYDAFYKTNLDEILHSDKIKQVIITGVMTHLCCETTARSAFVRGYEVFFPVNGTATYNENLHLASLTNLSHGFAIPVLTEDIIKEMKS
ncbi:MAG: isochorismatase family protein [Ignavibacteriae bacterium]|nr:MAG: isochorismatase family protein [Ignavibacteriota bacterium]